MGLSELMTDPFADQWEGGEPDTPPLPTRRILALDCATVTGWAHNCFPGIDSGVARFAPKTAEHPGGRFFRFETWLREQVAGLRPELIVCEANVTRQGFGIQAAELGAGFRALVQAVAFEHRAAYREVMASRLKLFATGNGRADKSAMIRAARDFHFEGQARPLTEDQADALCLLAFAAAGFPEVETQAERRKRERLTRRAA